MAEEREQWAGRASFIMAAVGSAVGLGNVWRFPYVCYQNGGGAFLIPYLIALLTAGIPLMILEYGLGHLMKGSAPLSFFKVNKKWEWVGWLALLIGFVIVCYYAVIMAWCFNYLYHSVKLSWAKDAHTFFNKEFLQLPDEAGVLGGIRWPIFACLLLTWVCIYLIIVKGVRRVGRVVMVTVPLPIILIAVLVVRGLTLPGAKEGLNFYLTPQFNLLLEPKVWLAAYSQIFFSLSLGFGILIAYASYLPRGSDIANNAFITSFTNCATSFFAGFAVFSTLGYLAQSQGKAVSEVVEQGATLAFVTYPTIISTFPALAARIFGAVFFILLLSLGIDSAFSLVEAAVAGGMDRWRISRGKVTFAVCLLAFLGGIIFTTQGGLFWLDTVDHFINNFGLALVGLATCIVIGYVFGAGKLRSHINEVSEFKIGRWWDACIMVITPLILGVSFIRVMIERIKVPYEGYPEQVLLKGGWGVIVAVVVLSLAFSRRWKPLIVIVGAVALIKLLSAILSTSAAFMFVVGFLVLFGGLAHCLHIALRKNNSKG